MAARYSRARFAFTHSYHNSRWLNGQPPRISDGGRCPHLTNIVLSTILVPMIGQGFFVLAVLADGPRHGYGIVSDVAELSDGRVRLKIGSLYGMLERLSADELIELDREESHDGRLRRYYRITSGGRHALAEEAELRAATARVARTRLGMIGPEAAGAGAAG
jgi:PadR family transcriptional regulator, regulatory protein PadR